MTRAGSPHGRRPRRRGQAMVEFALVVPFFLLLVFGIIEGGRFVFYYELLNHATREGARYAIVHGSNALGCKSGPMPDSRPPCDLTGERVKQRVRDSAFGALGTGLIVPDPIWQPNNERGNPVTVSASYAYTVLIPIVPLPPITVSAESTLVVNN